MSDSPRCDKCKYWAKSDGHDWQAKGSGMNWCKAVRERWIIEDDASRDMKLASADRYSEYTKARHAALREARAYVQDGSEYRAELVTAPDFFCALFQKLPADMVVAE